MRQLLAALSLALGLLLFLAPDLPAAPADGERGSPRPPSDPGDTARAAAPGKSAAPGKPTAPFVRPVPGPDYHIVLLADPPLARYRGGLPGLAATNPAARGDAGLDAESSDTQAYLAHLDRVQRRAILAIEREIGHPLAVSDRYRFALNGFAAWLAPAEAARVRRLPGVRLVHRQRLRQPLTDAGPAWSGARGIWDGSALGRPEGSLGEGVVVGVIDTGINTDHPSFAAVDGAGYAHRNPKPSYLGWCNPSHPQHRPGLPCNAKLIGLWSHPEAGNTPEDDDGHGSHVSSTAAGNRIDDARLIAPTTQLRRAISGMAPRANLAMYDGCAPEGCPDAATAAAAEQAVADGVDVINYSIDMGQESPWRTPVAEAFLSAFDAGIFVSVAAGNAGPDAGTIGANAPWVLTVGNNSHDRKLENALVDLSGGASGPPDTVIRGESFTGGLAEALPIVFAAGYTNVNGQPDDGMCLAPFPPGTFTGRIVVCNRGVAGRVEKGGFVAAGGASGYVLVNLEADGESLVADPHVLPAVHIGYADGMALKAWLAAGSGHMARIAGTGVDLDPANGDVMDGGSSRGPTVSSECCPHPDVELGVPTLLDVLKPDLSAPGTNIMAAVASGTGIAPPEYDIYSGTSMASPHAAGAAALLHAVHPDWSPAAIHSALMTTARAASMREADGAPADPFARGSGHIDAARAARAGIVLEETGAVFFHADPEQGGDPSTLNVASLHHTACLLSCGWVRRLTSALAERQTWTLSVEAPPGLEIALAQAQLDLDPGETAIIEVQADVSALPPDEWVFAEILLQPASEDVPPVHLPVAIRPVLARLPRLEVIHASEAQGQHRLGDLSAVESDAPVYEAMGLARGELEQLRLPQDPSPDDPFLSPIGKHLEIRTVPEDSLRLVAEVTQATASDIDLFVGRDDNGDGRPQPEEVQCVSGSPFWAEYCEVRDPEPGTWWILVQNWEASDSPPDAVTLSHAVVPYDNAGNFDVAGPAAIEGGEPFALDLSWELPELNPGDRWYGAAAIARGEDRTLLGIVGVDLVGIVELVTPTSPRPTDPTPVTPTPGTPEPTGAPPKGRAFLPLLLHTHADLGAPGAGAGARAGQNPDPSVRFQRLMPSD